MSVTAELCDRVVELGPGDLSDEARRSARRLILDGVAVGVAGSQEQAVRLLVDHYEAQGTAGRASVLGVDARLGVIAAAATNGAAMHVLDFEPMWSPANHALSTTLPVVLALAESIDVSGADVSTALVKGIEMQGWIRQASRQWEAGKLQFHPPGVVGPLGAAVAAGHLLALDAQQLRHALGIAASRSGALMANVGTMTKSLHCGQAAASGLEAAMLAARGFTANPDIFDAPRGLPDAFSPDFVVEDLLGFGPPFRLVEPGYALKLFPCQYGTHFAISAGLSARSEITDPETIIAVRLTAPVMAYVDRQHPLTGLDGKFSLQYTLAAALLDGAVGLDTFTDERLARADMQRVLGKIDLTMDPAIPGRFEDTYMEVEVELDGGQIIGARCDGPKGIWGAPSVSDAEHRAKVDDCLGRVFDDTDTESIVGQVNSFDTLDNRAIRHLLERVSRRTT